jgi:hypothetical protein
MAEPGRKSAAQAGQRFRVDLEAAAATVPAEVRLKRALKVLLRSFGLRCTGVSELKDEAPSAKS